MTSCFFGGSWDVSWHRSIGRDSFWTPAHRAICLSGVVAGIIGLWLVSKATLNRNPALGALSVSIFGMRAPLGVFIAGWGGMAMMTSAPFDRWWNNACGLDVKIVSPPYLLLILGFRAVGFGMLFLILAAMDRSKTTGADHVLTLRRLFFVRWRSRGGWADVSLQEFTSDVRLHTALAYVSVAIAVPILLATFSQVSAFQWAATTTAAVHTALILGEILLSQASPTQPKFGPGCYPVTHPVPSKFPVLMAAPAILLDLLWRNTRSWNLWQVVLVSRPLFTVASFAVEWPFRTFLLSKGSCHSFFGSIHHGHATRPESMDRMCRFFRPDEGSALAWGLARAALYAMISTWVGLFFGLWMRKVQR